MVYTSSMHSGLIIFQILLGVALSTCILIQSRGAGLGTAWGGSGGGYHTKRGFEKLLFRATIVLAVLFFGSSIVSLVV